MDLGSIAGAVLGGGGGGGGIAGSLFEGVLGDQMLQGMTQVGGFVMQTIAQPILQDMLSELGAEDE
ncbi:hypothetical protein GXW71_01000 [Roseomonas hellenica]|uniref:DUF937 domain-containing protein n=1 Tax=Plastoroseomonas hellenica TaxID=2687306 RepID=A0ABS5ERK5_9PROT|nr:hypothetical protein [Plastoroseomonas hellenica]MBR0662920.1 hypothetical protein [Plastoroseomonas hellenica]